LEKAGEEREVSCDGKGSGSESLCRTALIG
jgi:hypothetical protein